MDKLRANRRFVTRYIERSFLFIQKRRNCVQDDDDDDDARFMIHSDVNFVNHDFDFEGWVWKREAKKWKIRENYTQVGI